MLATRIRLTRSCERTARRGGRDIDGDDYARISASSLGLNRGPRIAVIYAAGAIASGKSGYDPVNGAVVGSDTLIEYIRQARRDTSIRAIVLRIDSPGGSVARVRRHLARADDRAQRERADRPIVASMSDLAASGGYYIAMPADSHRRAAVHVDRLDRNLRRQVRHRRPLREARREHRVHEHRQAR